MHAQVPLSRVDGWGWVAPPARCAQGVPLTLNALELRNPTLSANALGELLARRYGQQVVAQIYKVRAPGPGEPVPVARPADWAHPSVGSMPRVPSAVSLGGRRRR